MTYGASTLAGAAIASTTGSTRAGTGTAAASTTTASQATGTAEAVTVDDTDSVGYYGGATLGGAALGSGVAADAGTITSQTTADATATLTLGAVASTPSQTSLATTTTSAGEAVGLSNATTSAALVTTDAIYNEPIVEWRVTRDQTEVIDRVFDVDPVVDTANPFGDYAVFKADDSEGDLFGKFPRGTRVDIAVSTNGGITYENKFTGYTVERRENEQSGADVLEVEAYSFDQFLRRNTVSNDQTGNTIAEALEDIITTDTPVSYVAANVDVGDEQELTRSYRGVAVETALRDLAFKSNNEEFGVNDSIEFFFRDRETVHIDPGIDNTQWFNYDIPELGKETVNEVEVWFDDGNSSVVVDDGTDKLDLQDSLGLPDPGTQRAELNRPLITDISDAEDIGRKYLKFRRSTLSGTVTTFGLFDAQPGDTIDIKIDSRGIDNEFVIASTEYRWGRDQTILTIVEQRGDVDDILTELNESVKREEMQGANRDAPKNRITSTNAAAVVSVTADADGNTPDGDRFVNDGRRAVRDAYAGQSPPDITTLVVGSDGSGLSRSNTALENQTNSATVSQSLPDAKSVEFSASVTQSGVQEIGLEAADGTLITRATFDAPVDLDGTVTVTLSVSNDDSVSRGVLTNDGQTAIRDILADNNPTLPTDYGYGSDDTAVAETDTALGTEVTTVPLDEIAVQSADTNSDWSGITSFGATDPLTVQNGQLELAQTGFFAEVEDFANSGTTQSNSNASGGQEQFYAVGSDSFTFDLDYTIPEGEVVWSFRYRVPSGVTSAEITFTIDGQEVATVPSGIFDGDTSLSWFPSFGWSNGDLTPGSHTAGFDLGTTGEDIIIDAIAVVDDRTSRTFDNSVDSNQALSGPELYPTSRVAALDSVSLRQAADEVTFTSTWNDTSGGQYIEVSNDGGNNYERFNNTTSGTATFASNTKQLQANLNLARYSTGSTTTPTNGDAGQTVDLWDLATVPEAVRSDDINETVARAIVSSNTINGSTIREAGLKNGSTLLTRHILAEFTVLQDQRLASSETTAFTSDN